MGNYFLLRMVTSLISALGFAHGLLDVLDTCSKYAACVKHIRHGAVFPISIPGNGYAAAYS